MLSFHTCHWSWVSADQPLCFSLVVCLLGDTVHTTQSAAYFVGCPQNTALAADHLPRLMCKGMRK